MGVTDGYTTPSKYARNAALTPQEFKLQAKNSFAAFQEPNYEDDTVEALQESHNEVTVYTKSPRRSRKKAKSRPSLPGQNPVDRNAIPGTGSQEAQDTDKDTDNTTLQAAAYTVERGSRSSSPKSPRASSPPVPETSKSAKPRSRSPDFYRNNSRDARYNSHPSRDGSPTNSLHRKTSGDEATNPSQGIKTDVTSDGPPIDGAASHDNSSHDQRSTSGDDDTKGSTSEHGEDDDAPQDSSPDKNGDDQDDPSTTKKQVATTGDDLPIMAVSIYYLDSTSKWCVNTARMESAKKAVYECDPFDVLDQAIATANSKAGMSGVDLSGLLPMQLKLAAKHHQVQNDVDKQVSSRAVSKNDEGSSLFKIVHTYSNGIVAPPERDFQDLKTVMAKWPGYIDQFTLKLSDEDKVKWTTAKEEFCDPINLDSLTECRSPGVFVCPPPLQEESLDGEAPEATVPSSEDLVDNNQPLRRTTLDVATLEKLQLTSRPSACSVPDPFWYETEAERTERLEEIESDRPSCYAYINDLQDVEGGEITENTKLAELQSISRKDGPLMKNPVLLPKPALITQFIIPHGNDYVCLPKFETDADGPTAYVNGIGLNPTASLNEVHYHPQVRLAAKLSDTMQNEAPLEFGFIAFLFTGDRHLTNCRHGSYLGEPAHGPSVWF